MIVETVNHASNALDGFPDRARDNAELIVRAVNDHDELVSLLAQAVDCRKCHECPDEDWLERGSVGVGEGEGIVTADSSGHVPRVNVPERRIAVISSKQ